MLRKIIWSYWDGPFQPINKKCLKSWEKKLPDWKIHVLNRKTIKDYNIKKPNNYDSLSSTTQSDVIRLNLLYTYGGVWMDASIYLTENLDWLNHYSSYPLMGVKWDQNKYMESWFIAVYEKESKLIKLWLDTFIDILNTNPYNKHPAYQHTCTTDGNYFMIYQAWCYLMHKNIFFEKSVKNIPFIHNVGKISSKTVLIPLNSNEKFVKFTKGVRKPFKYIQFPLVYIYLLSIVILILIISFFLNKGLRRKKSRRIKK